MRPFSLCYNLFVTKNREETYALASTFITDIAGTRRKRALIIALYGDLGSGKTTFVQGCARALGITETVISPTFILERVYKIPRGGHFIHIDCYRLENEKEIEHLGWNNITHDPQNIIFVEWAQKIEKLLPSDAIKIYFEHVSEKEREIVIK